MALTVETFWQLPAALRLFRESSSVLWAEALVLFKCMSEDDNADVRWMLSHAIHCYPPLFESDCAPVYRERARERARSTTHARTQMSHSLYIATLLSVNPTVRRCVCVCVYLCVCVCKRAILTDAAYEIIITNSFTDYT
jgi:hypothetical protein